jgi:N-methylhydantoinase B
MARRRRDPERVLEDVREGYVSIERAREEYGVVLDPITLAVVSGETAKHRATMAPEASGSHPGSGQPG